ncbi:WecB/TagA/CpsF family glycosyltransferase [Salinilacustrithrix flava]
MVWRKDAAFREAYERAHVVLLDGLPLLWLASLEGIKGLTRVAGSDLVERICSADFPATSLFVLGMGPVENLEAQEAIRDRTGHHVDGVSPPFGATLDVEWTERVTEMIGESGATIVFVCLGAPKSELWVAHNMHLLPPAYYLCVGGALEMYSGQVRRAPVALRQVGLEWLYRLCQEPRRLWRRYLLRDMPFVLILVQTFLARLVKSLRAR